MDRRREDWDFPGRPDVHSLDRVLSALPKTFFISKLSIVSFFFLGRVVYVLQ